MACTSAQGAWFWVRAPTSHYLPLPRQQNSSYEGLLVRCYLHGAVRGHGCYDEDAARPCPCTLSWLKLACEQFCTTCTRSWTAFPVHGCLPLTSTLLRESSPT